MSQTTVDVIIPTHNGLPYLKETVESVLAQTHKHLNLYVVDDGSTDGGATKKYITGIKDPRVIYVSKTNGGQATARNVGAKKGKAPFVAFLDSDDVWYPTKLQQQLAAIEQHPHIGMVYGLCDYIDDDSNHIGELNYQRSGRLFDYLLTGNRITGSASMVLIRRSVLEALGYFKEDLLVAEDWALWMEIAKDYEISCVPEKLAALRVRGDSMQTDFNKMAKGLDYMYPIMVATLKLTRHQRALFAACCLGDAAYFYILSGKRQAARHCLWTALKASPVTALRLSPRRYSVYVRALKP